MPEGAPEGAPVGLPEAAPDGAPDGAPLGAPLGRPDAPPVGMPDGGWQLCWAEPPPEDEESPEPHAVSSSGESASRATAGTRRARFMRASSRMGEEVLRRALNQRRLGRS